ncbi:MAG TPA: tRNA glutamyl-Q(34) synthetase GluQRS, partial [Acidobacteriaceae bacterium]
MIEEAVIEQPYVGRLAPSPTGLLHLGHARTFWIAAQRARAADGVLWLRDEDLDPQRSRPEFAQAMRDDLHWLGITWDYEMRQSQRLAAYRSAMEQLVASGSVYACRCSRKDLQQATQAPHEDDDEPVYNGHCRPSPQHCESSADALLPNTNYRFRVNDGEIITFVDGNAGEQSFVAGSGPTADFGDFVVWRKDGLPSYQLACVVDDAAMGVTEVVRGRDLLRSTARQILLQRALEVAAPQYFHCDLMRDEAGFRLAK